MASQDRYENEFEPLEKIGEGMFGNVFKVKEKRTGNLFAIKRIQIKSMKKICLK